MTPANVSLAQLKEFFNSLNDRVLEPGDPVYVGQVHAQGSSGGDPIKEMANEIEWQEGGGVCLFTGQRGTGKSTELKRLKKRVEDSGSTVFYVDLSEYLLLTKEVEISDFLVSVAGAMSDQVAAKYGKSPGNRSYWDIVSTFLQRDVEIKEIGVSLAGVDIKASLKTDPDFKRRVQHAARGHVARLVAEAHAFIADAVDFVRKQEGNPNRKVVLIIDSVERIRGVGSEAMAVYESVRNLFCGHAENLRIPLLHVVYTIPPYLSVLAPGAGSLMGGANTQRLVSTHIFKDRSRDPDGVGLAVLQDVIAVRYPAWTSIFTSAALNRLALNSGGDMREFFRLIRRCLVAVGDTTPLPLSVDAIAHAENSARNEMLPIPADHLAWLKRISETHNDCLGSDKDLPTLAHFLDNRLVLNYLNGTSWYDVHPLLREVVDAHDPTGRA